MFAGGLRCVCVFVCVCVCVLGGERLRCVRVGLCAGGLRWVGWEVRGGGVCVCIGVCAGCMGCVCLCWEVRVLDWMRRSVW